MKNSDHVRWIDGLRAIAVLAVVLDHGTIHNPALVDTKWPEIAFVGAHGVELFFVISGLCLAGTFLRRFEKSGTTGFDGASFFAKRIVRILPPYYITVGLLALASILPVWVKTTAAPAGGSMTLHLTLKSLVAHLFFSERIHESLNASFWTLRVEAIWYVLFPLALIAYVRFRPAFWIVGAICAVLAYLAPFASELGVIGTVFAMATALPAFMLGIVAADPRVEAALSPKVLWPAFVVSLAASIVTDHVTGSRVLWGVAAFAFVLLARRDLRLRALLSVRALSSIGVVSYSIYLVHEPLIAMLEYSGIPQIAAMIAGVAAGAAFWWAVERPITEDPLRRSMVVAIRNALAKLPFVKQPASSEAAIR